MSYLDNLTATLSPTISLVLCLKTLAVCSFAYFLLCTLNYITFDPRAKLPGPKLRGAFQLPDYWSVITGKHYRQWNALHEKYGEVVRMSPDLVSFINPEAWREIYGFGNTTPLAKDPHFYFRPPSDIASANDADHARIRRPLNHAFSEQALRSQESMINSYITLLTKKLHRRAVEKTPVDLVQWLNFTTFDITGDLTFGESFGALDQETYNFWMANLFNAFRFASILGVIKRLPVIGKLSIALLKSIPALSQAEHQHNTYTEKKIAKRLATETDRKDFVSYILKNKGAITNYELEQTSGTLIVGGSETIATLLSGVFYYLQRNPQWMDKLHNEIRTAFASESDINFAALSQLKVLNAIIYETFRIYPPVPAALPRIVPKEGATICGRWLPAGTRVGVPQYAMYHSTRYFTNPEVYAPERFLGAKEYENDQRNVIQPFSVGPRNCIGQSLAWAEARAIIARLVWNFEFELLDKEVKWENQRVFVLWEKPELMVRLKAREGVM